MENDRTTVILLNNVYLIFIVFVGIVGNILTILVFRITQYKSLHRIRCFLIYLAISDSIYLCVLLLHSVQDLTKGNLLNKHYICQITTFISYLAAFMSSQMITILSIQKLICLKYQKNVLYVNCFLRRVVISLVFIGFLLYSYSFWTFSVVDGYCKAIVIYETLIDHLNIVDSFLTFFIPFFSFLILNIQIIYLVKSSNYNHLLCNCYSSSESSRIMDLRLNLSHSTLNMRYFDLRRRKHRSNCTTVSKKIIKLVFLISAFTLLFNLPYHLINFYFYLMVSYGSLQEFSLFERFLLLISKNFYCTSFSLNFFVYVIVLKSFRNDFKRLHRQVRKILF
jgi:hypothetical protein